MQFLDVLPYPPEEENENYIVDQDGQVVYVGDKTLQEETPVSATEEPLLEPGKPDYSGVAIAGLAVVIVLGAALALMRKMTKK